MSKTILEVGNAISCKFNFVNKMLGRKCGLKSPSHRVKPFEAFGEHSFKLDSGF
jgi:hypothetical protein